VSKEHSRGDCNSFQRSCLLSLLIGWTAVTLPVAETLASEVHNFPLPTGVGSPEGITAGPDGNFWFTELAGDKIGRIAKDGAITEFSVPTPRSFPHGIAVGPDGNLWFTEINASQIGRISTSGVVTEFPLPTPNSQAHAITRGPDGNLWFTEINVDRIGRITTDGLITEFPLPTAGIAGQAKSTCGPSNAASQPYDIAEGADRSLWFTECNSDKIGRISTAGVITEFPLGTPGREPHGITMGPDGNLWFTEFGADKIGIISTDGVVLGEIQVPTATSGPHAIIQGPDRKLWFTELTVTQLASVTVDPKHTVLEYPIPVTASNSAFGNLFDIASELDHAHPRADDGPLLRCAMHYLWFTELGSNAIGEFQVPSSLPDSCLDQ
jgi:virginiamycin B lyase